jgi:hypothetical protein
MNWPLNMWKGIVRIRFQFIFSITKSLNLIIFATQMKCILGLFSFSFFFSSLFAQIDSSRIYYRKVSSYYIADSSYFHLDTNLYGLHQPNPISFLGNIGMSQLPLLFQFQSQNLSNHAYQVNLNVPVFKLEDVKFCSSYKPFFSIYAFSGKGQEQLLDAFHTQTLRKQFSYTFRFYRGNSQGFISRQRTNFSQFYLSLNIPLFKNKKGFHRLKLMPFLINNLNNFNENGGASSDSALDNAYKTSNFFSSSTVKFLKVRQAEANRKISNFAVGSENIFLLKNDSASGSQQSIVHHIFADRQKNYFTDKNLSKDQTIYPIFYDSSNFTNDSIHHFTFSNAISYRAEKVKRYFYEVGGKHENTLYINHGTNKFNDNYNLFANAYKQFGNYFNTLNLSAQAEYCAVGNLQNGTLLRANAIWSHNDSIKKIWQVNAQFEFSNRKPLLFYQQYSANSFVWKNEFNAVLNQQLNLTAQYLPLKLSAGIYYQTLYNGIIFNQYQRPEQIGSAIGNTRLFVSHQFVWKRLRFFNTVHYQVTSNSDVIKIPNLYSQHALFYESKLIKKNFKFQIGLDLQYIPSFQSYAYSTGTNQFYLQNTFKTKDQIYADVFFNVFIKPAYIFVKMEHANQFYFPQQSEVVQNYLLKPRALRFGVRWNFLD